MTERIWDRFLTESDNAHIAASAPKVPRGFGNKPAILSVDNYRAAVGDTREPLQDSIRKWPSSTGLVGWAALDNIAEMFTVARGAGIPVIHVTALSEEESGMPGWRSARRLAGSTASRSEEELDRHRRRYEIVDEAAPVEGEVVFKKNSPSAFFGTPLAAHVIQEGIDTLIVCGESVSGCIRATVVDGCSYRLRMIVVEECVYDRHEASRAMNLFDIDQKYGDVISLADTMDWMLGKH